ncbi:MAG: cell envelope integrity protein TolA [Gammaproteobacteria bacterium TMED182]|nr:protein TolA [Gammaproteobacteria bacterium]RPG48410.1 MAG: cell envelope integrity protein TolA [Gammaproteobacteria bacterium TMED182]
MKSLMLPTALALGFHGLILSLFLIDWPEEASSQVRPELLFVSASLVKKSAPEVDAAQKVEPKSPKTPLPSASKKTPQPKQAADAPQTKAPVNTAPQIKDRDSAADSEKVNAQKRLDAEQREKEVAAAELADRLASLEEAVTDEIGREAVTNDEKIMAYIGQIQRDIINKWSRPPSARNGMQAILRVRLVPTGEVVDVVVATGSRNDAFDRSALLAVRRAERFEVPTDTRLFEQHFRSFTVLFRPEDLRL